MRPSKDKTCLNVAAEWARRSTCLRRAVGCVLVNERGHTLSTGYNGRAAGLPHCNEETGGGISVQEIGDTTPNFFPSHANSCVGAKAESGAQLDACEAIHAEQNALLQCRNVWEIHTCYVTHSPCITCVKLLMNTSCTRIVFSERYAHDEASMKLWMTIQGRTWEHFELRP